ncbi:hypothetical protein FOXYS1_5280 [Fusarium oxysporum]|uniref:Major facilitator superfamily (MFS) profile domain-containing protein n=1 Tax=Fusarium oxysporum TaxID=5507 RepID=A0A8H5EL62_FUSOX|nr:hypothetical protein FOXYS1_5280 [Fusarium oxysporum]
MKSMNQPAGVSSVINQIEAVGDSQQLPELLRVASTIKPSKIKQYLITFLILICNLTQFISMFSTVAGGYELSKILGKPVGPGQANWMAAAYSLTQSAFVLISGRLGAVYGHQKLLLLGGVIIVTFSIANAFCNTYNAFIAIRALTGVGGGILMPNAVATLTIMVPPGKVRNFTLAIFAASPPVGAGIGSLMIGAFLEYSEWKWHFISVYVCISWGYLFLWAILRSTFRAAR